MFLEGLLFIVALIDSINKHATGLSDLSLVGKSATVAFTGILFYLVYLGGKGLLKKK